MTDKAETAEGTGQAGQPTIAELYKALQIHDSIIITCLASVVSSIKKRISKRKYTEAKQLGEFAGERMTLVFSQIPAKPATPDTEVKLSITLKTSDVGLTGIAAVTLPQTMDEIIEGVEPTVLPMGKEASDSDFDSTQTEEAVEREDPFAVWEE